MTGFNRHPKVGFVASCFDLLHAGHCLMLKDAKRQCDHLVAGLQVDPSVDRPNKNKPILSLEERRILLQSNRYVDEIIEYSTEEELTDILENLLPDVATTEGRLLLVDYTAKKFIIMKEIMITQQQTLEKDYYESISNRRSRIYWQQPS